MEFASFEKVFRVSGFSSRQIKKIQMECYRNYEDAHGKRIATSGQKRMSYDFLINLIRDMEYEEIGQYMYSICRATDDQCKNLYDELENVA